MQTIEAPPKPAGLRPWPLSVAAYQALGEAGLAPEKTELLYGFIYQKMPKSPFHVFILRRLLRLLQSVVSADLLLSSEQPITCTGSEPEPDIAIIRGSEFDFRDEHPKTAELVIEVCVSSHEYDRFKLRAYATASVKEVWLILVPERQVEVYLHPQDGRFTEQGAHGPGGQLRSMAVPAFTLDLDTFFSE